MSHIKKTLGGLIAILAFLPLSALAGTVTWPQDTNLYLSGSGITLLIRAGSVADDLIVNASTFTVTVGAGDSFLLRYAGPDPGTLSNDGALSGCTRVGDNNDLTVDGPVTVTFTPNATVCVASSAGSRTPPPSIDLSVPAVGDVLTGGTTHRAWWSASGSQLQSVRLRLSIGGVDQGVVADQPTPSNGYVDWTVPAISTSQAMLTAEALGAGGVVLASDVSGSFRIAYASGSAPAAPAPSTPPISPPPSATAYSPSAARTQSTSIGADKGLTGTSGACAGRELIKLPDDGDAATQYDSAVYYCGADGKRYGFPNQKIYATWYADFGNVSVIDAATMSSIPLGGNVTYRPGVRMIKIQSDPKVYAVDLGGTLHWVQDEATAARLYGEAWNTQIDDVSDAFFVNYKIGAPIAS